jgi:DNA gyrase subunit B
MTDADVDGAHIRTLLLTFFFRQMPQIIERGYLYIAQPPLYKYKKGKLERYLKDDSALLDFLSDAGISNVEVKDAQGRVIDRNVLKSLMSKLQRYLQLMDMACRRRARGVVDYIIQHDDIGPQSLSSEEAALALGNRICDDIKTHNPKAFTNIQVIFDQEYSRYRLMVETRERDIPQTSQIDAGFFASGEIVELKRLRKQMDEIAQAPFSWTSLKKSKKDEAEESVEADADGAATPAVLRTLADLKEFIVLEGRKGAYVQRYKGLGEMNPDQLADTTMKHDHRTLLQVEVEDAMEADSLFSTLMGDDVDPRREFIQQNALNVRNLDI